MNTFEQGIQSEKQALQFFVRKGYICLAQRFKTAYGEIDLIVEKGKQLIFVEVKKRPFLSQGLYSLRTAQCQRIYNAALIFLQKYPPHQWINIQIDLVVCTKDVIHHIPHIWTDYACAA
jgi:putative endonuclease